MKPSEPVSLLLAFAVFFIIFVPLEALIPHKPRKILRPGFRTDVAHFFVNGLLRKFVQALLIVPVIYALGFLIHPPLQAWVRAQPWWLQFVEAVLIQEFGGYFGHRLAHRVPFLWRFHAVHHSSEQMDWLAAAHLHPFDQALIRAWAFIPLYMLGFSKETFGFFIGLEGLNAIFIHSNIRFRCGWLEKLIATPAFHHWHHNNDDPKLRDKNFAGLLPFVDKLFGTYYLPKNKLPEHYGIPESLPAGYVQQLWYPLRQYKRPRNPA